MRSIDYSDYDDEEISVEQRFERLYPDYDYSSKSSYHEKDTRRKKRMKTMY